MRHLIPTASAVVLVLTAAAGPATAQGSAQHDMAMMEATDVAGKHLTVTPHWPVQPGDSARADSIVEVNEAALAKYGDVAVAEADGFKMFAPKVKKQKVYHYTRRMNAIKARWTFDATAPTSLLYAPQPDGTVRLIGAMYTTPPNFTLAQLDARIPLSIAQWHQHTSICLPPGADVEAGLTTRDPRFGPRGSISTEEACRAAGGTFKTRMAGWMVHVNMFEAPDQVWEHKH
ncbi:MAG: hypothetical protein R2910_11975 [Gemmatimonadales bacterium]